MINQSQDDFRLLLLPPGQRSHLRRQLSLQTTVQNVFVPSPELRVGATFLLLAFCAETVVFIESNLSRKAYDSDVIRTRAPEGY